MSADGSELHRGKRIAVWTMAIFAAISGGTAVISIGYVLFYATDSIEPLGVALNVVTALAAFQAARLGLTGESTGRGWMIVWLGSLFATSLAFTAPDEIGRMAPSLVLGLGMGAVFYWALDRSSEAPTDA